MLRYLSNSLFTSILGVSLITLLLFTACTSDQIQTITLENTDEIISYSIDKDSLIQGLYVQLNREGDTISVAHYKDNQLEGKRNIYATHGYVEIEQNYKGGVFHGPIVHFYPDGTPETSGNFTNGQLDSLFYAYYPSGKLKEKVSIKNNLENGPFEEYYENGNIHWKGQFIDGDNEIGLLEEFAEDGTLIKKMDCGKYKGDYICQTIWSLEKGDVVPKLKYD
jgi:antitoxin component YwqK of YwqJK toxin-antitoxin module